MILLPPGFPAQVLTTNRVAPTRSRLTNGYLPSPEYRVNCVMCDQSFSATADTLAELVQIVALHLQQAENPAYPPHMKYRAYLEADPVKRSEEKKAMEALLENYRTDPSEIVRSPLFAWDILRLVPYVRIYDEVKIPLPSKETVGKREEMASPKTH